MQAAIVMLLTIGYFVSSVACANDNLRPNNSKFTFQKAAVSLANCSGVLIHPRIVLTAAHCFINPEIPNQKPQEKFVYFTPEDIFEMNANQIAVPAVKVIDYSLAPSFGYVGTPESPKNIWGDLAIVLLEKEGPLDYPVLPIAPEVESFEHYVSLGFGLRLNDQGVVDLELPRKLKASELTLKSESFPNQEAIYLNQPKVKICGGDSGGPLLGRLKGAWYVIGVNSFIQSQDINGIFDLGSGLSPKQDCGRTVVVQSAATHKAEIEEMIKALLAKHGVN